MEIQTRELVRIKRRLNEILVNHTGKPLETIEKDTDRDFFMGPEEAKDYGLVDQVIFQRQAKES